MNLSQLKIGESAYIIKVSGNGAFKRRITEMGFVRGQKITAVMTSPLADPVTYRIMNYEVALRSSETQLIEVSEKPIHVAQRESCCSNSFCCKDNCCHFIKPEHAPGAEKVINIALVGNPNSGKTSLFNVISGGRERVGNYSGVTVGEKYGHISYGGYTINIVDLPGTYSLSAYSPEERYVQEYLKTKSPDVVVNVLASSSLERNLFLTTELMDIRLPVVCALNMYDEITSSGASIDYEQLACDFGIPMVPTVAKKSSGIKALLDMVIRCYQSETPLYKPVHIDYSSIDEEDESTAIANRRYEFITECVSRSVKETTDKIKRNLADRIVTNKWLGFTIFILAMYLVFSATFTLGAYPQEWIEGGISWFSNFISMHLSNGIFKDLLIDGVIGGVGGVLVFIPNIVILYLFIVLMEGTGYMARAAYIMDKIMSRFGLDGRSFIPMLMGFGCNVPAIMAARTIENRKSRLITILINPFMSCSARLPVYVLIAGSLFHDHAALVVMSLYVLGIIFAALTALILNRGLKQGDDSPFILEMPPYRIPGLVSVLKQLWFKCEFYIKRIGTKILLASIIIWALSYFPNGYHGEMSNACTDECIEYVTSADSSICEHGAISSNDSYLARLGKVCEPIMQPMGLDWRASVSLLSGIPAKELIVSTMGVLYGGVEEFSEGSVNPNIVKAFTPASAIAFLIFILLYFPCIGTLAAISAETQNKRRWVVFSILYSTSVAWLASFAAYHIALLFM